MYVIGGILTLNYYCLKTRVKVCTAKLAVVGELQVTRRLQNVLLNRSVMNMLAIIN